MDAAENYQTEAEAIFRRWLANTVQVLEQERARLDLADSEELKKSLTHKVVQVAADTLGGQIIFLTRGRFVDMGAGRRAAIERLGSRPKLATRKPKKWYSPAFYGRLNDLQGALGIQLMEKSLEALRTELTEKGNV